MTRKKWKRSSAAETAVFASVICAVLSSIGLTTAYRTDHASVRNTMIAAGEDALDAVLEEPSWKEENAVLAVPGAVIPKDPQITNTSAIDLDELAAIRMEFRYGADCPDHTRRGSLLSEEDMRAVMQAYEIDYNAELTGEWVRFSGEDDMDAVQHFYYRDVLERNYPGIGETTKPLFTSLSVPPEIGNPGYRGVQAIGGFDIVLTGMVLQHMEGDVQFGLNSAEEAYEAGLFTFEETEQKE